MIRTLLAAGNNVDRDVRRVGVGLPVIGFECPAIGADEASAWGIDPIRPFTGQQAVGWAGNECVGKHIPLGIAAGEIKGNGALFGRGKDQAFE